MARKRKYLDDIGYTDRPDTWNKDDKRQKIWRKQRKKYGFDNREIWNMDLAFYLWLYERLIRLRFYLSDKYKESNDEHFDYVNKVQYMWAEILHSMWY